MADALPVELRALAEATADGVSAAFDIGAGRTVVRASMAVLALTGTRLSVTLETSPDGTLWRQVGLVGSLLGVARIEEVTLGLCERYIRARWDLTGTAVTFSVAVVAHQLYASPADIRRAHLPDIALEDVVTEQEIDALLAGTDEAEGYLASGSTLPLLSWSNDLRSHVAGMAAYSLMRSRGFDPSGIDALIVKSRDDAIAWLDKIASRKLTPPGFVDSTPSAGTSPSAARVRGAEESRGW